jgi:chromosome segregation ATPase
MMQPRDDPNVMSRQEHELRLELEKRKSEIDQKEREMEDLKARMERLESGPLPNQLPPNELEKDKQIDRLERKMEEMQRQRDSELRDQRMDGRLKMIEHQLNETRGGREETIDLLKRQGLIGQPQGMSDTAQVQMKELDTKLGVFTKSVDDLKDIAKTWMTMGQPMRRSGAPLTEEERELARRELGG